MRYNPVYVARITRVKGIASMKRREWLAIDTTKLPSYWAATSKLLGECGHKHKTQAAAEPCKERMLILWRERRLESLRAALKKKALLKQACDTFQNTMPAIAGLVRMANGF